MFLRVTCLLFLALPVTAQAEAAGRLEITGLPEHSFETSKPVLESIEVANIGTEPLVVVEIDGLSVSHSRFRVIFPGQKLPVDVFRVASRWDGHVDLPGLHKVKHSVTVVAPLEAFLVSHLGGGVTLRYGCHSLAPRDAAAHPAREHLTASDQQRTDACVQLDDSETAVPGPRLTIQGVRRYDVQADPEIEEFRRQVKVTSFRKNLPVVGTVIETRDMSYLVQHRELKPIGRVSTDALEELFESWSEKITGIKVYVRADAHGASSAMRVRFGTRFEKGIPLEGRGVSPRPLFFLTDADFLPSELAQKKWQGTSSDMPGEVALSVKLSELSELWRVLRTDGTRLCPPTALDHPVYVTRGACDWSKEQKAHFDRPVRANRAMLP